MCLEKRALCLTIGAAQPTMQTLPIVGVQSVSVCMHRV